MHSVVEVAGRFAVDGDDWQVAVVAAMLEFARGDDALNGLRLVDYRRRKAMRQVELADHDLDIHSEIVLFAENLDDTTARILRSRRPVGDLDVDYDSVQILPVSVLGG